ncbi:MAG: DUF3306 domain-containing protein [Hyphomicrobiaceae bacterium]
MTANTDKPDHDPAGDDGEGFLARWSRVKRGAVSVAPAVSQPGPPVADAAAATATDEEPPVDLARLPKIEDLLPTSDITAFLKKGVPDELKRLALRKAWSLDPAIRDFIEVAENQYNWNAPDGVPGFGALDPGVDIEALLAQATGQIRAVAEAPTQPIAVAQQQTGIGEVVSPAAFDPVNPEASAEAPVADATPLPDAPQAPSSVMAAAAPDQPQVDAAPQQSRPRHGGALPRFS